MSSISSLSAAVSALMSSQTALNTTAHNLANVNTPGYVRQQVLMKDNSYMNLGQNGTTGFYVGLGVDVQQIRQIRDRFLDQAYRQENSRQGFYAAQNNAIEEIETILGETEGESFSKVLNNLWQSLNEISKNPDGLETRGALVQNAVLFINRANLISNQLNSYQDNMNSQVMDMVKEINHIGEQINDLNGIIVKAELSGGQANDYRDQRNSLIDKLSTMVDVNYKEDLKGNVLVQIEGMEFVSIGGYNKMGIAAAEPFSTLVKPIWTHLSGTNNDVFDYATPINTENDNDKGKLKGLLLGRGTRAANYTDMQNLATYQSNIKPSIIMNAQAQFDNLVHGVVTMMNNVIAPNIEILPATVPPTYELDTVNAPYGLDGSQGIELFSRKSMTRYTAGVYNDEDPANTYSLYSAGNIAVNQAILDDYDKICLSGTMMDLSDNTFIQKMITKWQEPFSAIEPGLTSKLNFNAYYNDYISVIGNNGNSVYNKMSNQEQMVIQINNQRSSRMEVSSDEELSNMIKFQHAYNAAAKVVSTLDQMMEQVVKSTGLVGR
ncbi:MAG: flagellar hook-associated protein FlgK [Firmicutes bacterium HGW-Firmicutes-1]|jgi:flagellar hook-associated protein 1 FlgK|nr:MAG: flagellar hook-associated protein FlgK [Firmicutes bacterium HGW-Firmicutes-1]